MRKSFKQGIAQTAAVESLDYISGPYLTASHALVRTSPIGAVDETRIDTAAVVLVPSIPRPNTTDTAESRSSNIFCPNLHATNLDVHLVQPLKIYVIMV